MKNKEFMIWLAGFWEGDGLFHYHIDKKGTYHFKVTISQSKERGKKLLEKIQRILGLGSIYKRKFKVINSNRWSSAYIWEFGGREDIKKFFNLIFPYLQFRKKEVKKKLNILYSVKNGRIKWNPLEIKILKEKGNSLTIKELSKLLPRHSLTSITVKKWKLRKVGKYKE